MADQILKLHPIPADANADKIKNILKDFTITEVSIRGDAAYVKFQKFGEDEKDILQMTFQDNKYTEGEWNANLTLLSASDWDSEEGEVIQAPKSPKDSEAQELKKSGVLSSTKDNQALTASQNITEVIQETVPEVNEQNFPQIKSQVNNQPTHEIVNQRQSTQEIPKQKVQQIPRQSIKAAKEVELPYPKIDESASLARPVGTRQQVQGLINEMRQEVSKQLNYESGRILPLWIWPVALSWTMLALSMH